MSTPNLTGTHGGATAAPEPEPQRRASQRRAPEPNQPKLEPDAKLRLALQRRAVTNLRRHLRRGAIRTGVLAAADLAVFWLLRSLIRSVRDAAVLGDTVAGLLNYLLPRDYLSGFQYAIALIIGLAITGNYRQGDRRRDPSRLMLGVALATALPMWTFMWARSLELFAVQYLVTTGLVWIAIVLERFGVDRVVAIVRQPEKAAAPTLFVGTARASRRVMQSEALGTSLEHRSLGYVSCDAVIAGDALGSVAHFPRLLKESRAEVIVVCGDLAQERLHQVVDASFAAGCQVLAIPESLDRLGVRPAVIWRDGHPLLELTQPAQRARALIVKRVIDFAGSLVGLIALSPLLLLIAALIKLDSRGPMLFRQRRVGLGGTTLGMLKFRTMHEGADGMKAELGHLNHTGDHRLFKIPNDPRVTRVGAFLRRWSLDELPQLINVLVGDMSLVGPRPFFSSDLEQYELHHFDRLGAKPGMTGLWQVSGRSAVMDFEEVVQLDRKYIMGWSLGLDLWILLRTLPAVVSRRGAF